MVLDLRTDTGGNMWPMIGGLAPLIGTGQVGSFVYPDGTIEPWTLIDGVASWDGMVMAAYDTPIEAGHPPVAVLIGPRTASSGEATAVAFHGRPTRASSGSRPPGSPPRTNHSPCPMAQCRS